MLIYLIFYVWICKQICFNSSYVIHSFVLLYTNFIKNLKLLYNTEFVKLFKLLKNSHLHKSKHKLLNIYTEIAENEFYNSYDFEIRRIILHCLQNFVKLLQYLKSESVFYLSILKFKLNESFIYLKIILHILDTSLSNTREKKTYFSNYFPCRKMFLFFFK